MPTRKPTGRATDNHLGAGQAWSRPGDCLPEHWSAGHTVGMSKSPSRPRGERKHQPNGLWQAPSLDRASYATHARAGRHEQPLGGHSAVSPSGRTSKPSLVLQPQSSQSHRRGGDGHSIAASSVTLAGWSSSSVGKQIGHQWPPDLASSCLGFEGHRSMELRSVLSDVVRTGVVRSAKSASGPLRKSLRPLAMAGQNPDFPYGGGLWVGHRGPGLVPKITPAAPLGRERPVSPLVVGQSRPGVNGSDLKNGRGSKSRLLVPESLFSIGVVVARM